MPVRECGEWIAVRLMGGLNSNLDLTVAAVLIVGTLFAVGAIVTLSRRDRLQKRRQVSRQDPTPPGQHKNTLSASKGEVVLGMTTEEVIANCGHPKQVHKIEASGGLREGWVYCPSPECFHDRIYLIFERGQLISWHEIRPQPIRLPLAFPPSPITVLRHPAVQEYRQQLQQIRDPLVRVVIGWPMFLWRAWDWFRLNWRIKRSLKAMDRSERKLKRAWATFALALQRAKNEKESKTTADK